MAALLIAHFVGQWIADRPGSSNPATDTGLPFTAPSGTHMKGKSDFGPNGRQVEAFLSTLGSLGPADWWQIEFEALDGGRSQLSNFALQRRRTAIQRDIENSPAASARNGAVSAALEAFHTIADGIPAEDGRPSAIVQMIVVVALTALVHRDRLSTDAFEALYHPLEPVVPFTSLIVSE